MEPIAVVLLIVVALGLVSLAAVALYLVRRSAPVVAPDRVEASVAEQVSLRRFRARHRWWIAALFVAFPVGVGNVDRMPEWLETSLPLWLATLAIAALAVWPHPGVEVGEASGVRSADVQPRTMRNVVPSWALIPPAMGAAVLVVFLVVAGVVAEPHGGRVIVLAPGATSELNGVPFPGWPWGLPILVALLPLAGVVLLALYRIASYPAPLDPASRPLDAGLRRTSTRLVMKLATAAIFVCLGLGLSNAGGAVANAADAASGATGSFSPGGWQVVATIMWTGGVVFGLLAFLLAASLAIDAWFDPRLVAVTAASSSRRGSS